MKQTQGSIKNEHQISLHNSALFPASVQAGLRELNIPVAEFIPEERVQFSSNISELKAVVCGVKGTNQTGQTREHPAIRFRLRLRLARNETVQVHIHKTGSIANLVGKVTAANQLILVELQILGTGNLHKQTEAHAVGTVILHQLQGIHAIAATLRHRLAIGSHNRGMDDDVLERDLIGKVERRHYHACNPQAHNIASGR